MVRIIRAAYLAGGFLLLVQAILDTPWAGRSYSGDAYGDNPGAWVNSGAFGIQPERAPIWNPPAASGGGMNSTVRWPWQKVVQSKHVEIDLGALAARWSAGMIVVGLVIGALGLIIGVARGTRGSVMADPVVSIAWQLSVALIIAWLCAVILVVTGNFPTGSVFAGLQFIAVVAALLYARATHVVAVRRVMVGGCPRS